VGFLRRCHALTGGGMPWRTERPTLDHERLKGRVEVTKYTRYQQHQQRQRTANDSAPTSRVRARRRARTRTRTRTNAQKCARNVSHTSHACMEYPLSYTPRPRGRGRQRRRCTHWHVCTSVPARLCLHVCACTSVPARLCLHVCACTSVPARRGAAVTLSDSARTSSLHSWAMVMAVEESATATASAVDANPTMRQSFTGLWRPRCRTMSGRCTASTMAHEYFTACITCHSLHWYPLASAPSEMEGRRAVGSSLQH
jgi:hypothetical protein